jgi:hypothetical protein
MSRKHKFHDQAANYFVSFASVFWIDVFTRKIYKDIIVDNMKRILGSGFKAQVADLRHGGETGSIPK